MIAKEQIICAHCGKEFTDWKYRERKYCSKNCFLESKRVEYITKTCEHCGETFEVKPQRKDTARYCSKSCRMKAQWASGKMDKYIRYGEDHPNYQGPQVVSCAICGEHFKVSASYYNWSEKKGGKHYCSKKCRSIGQSERQTGKTRSPRATVTCSACGKEYEVLLSEYERALERNQQDWYCSHKCHSPGPVTVHCDWCGKEFEISRRYYNHREKKGYEGGPFCSSDCMQEWQSEVCVGPNSSNWHGGSSFEPYDPDFDKKLRKRVRQRDNYKCQLCGKTQEDNLEEHGRRLCVHHVDYSKDNHSLNNLVTLCHPCHSQTNGNRDHFEKLFTEMLSTKKELQCIPGA